MSEKTLGLWNMGEELFHRMLSPKEAKDIIRYALSIGITSFDSAFSYKAADSYLAAVIREKSIPRDKIRITTKVMPVPTLLDKVDVSLRRLNTEYVDALLIHWPTSDEERLFTALRTLEKLKEEGKCREIGVSNFTPKLLKRVKSDFDITIHQRPLSLFWAEDTATEAALKINVMAYAPLSMGILTDKNLTTMKKELPLFNNPYLEPLRATILKLRDKYSSSVEELAYTFTMSYRPDWIVCGASKKEHLLIKPIQMTDEDLKELKAKAEYFFSLYHSDNIFDHHTELL